MLAALREPDAWIEHDALALYTGAVSTFDTRTQLRDHLANRVITIHRMRERRHVGNVAPRVHQDNPRPAVGAYARHVGIEPKARDIIHDGGTCRDRLRGDTRLHRVHRYRDSGQQVERHSKR